MQNLSPEQAIKQWVKRISQKQEKLGGHRVCPFARLPQIITVDKLSIEKFIKPTDKITIYIEEDTTSTYAEIEDLCKTLRDLNPDHIFLPDHPHRPNYINGIETGNGMFPCIIVQTRQELNSARTILEKTDYYRYWDKDYLAEIKSFS